MSQPKVLVVRTGTANLASVFAALRRIGAEPELTEDAHAVAGGAHVVLPGVGALGAAMDALEPTLIDDALRARIHEGLPTLAICLGMQLLLAGSEESPGIPALGCVPGTAKRFIAEGIRVPHLGWNTVSPEAGSRFLEPGYAYFAHSFHVPHKPVGWKAAWTTHGGPFVSAFEREDVLACQFHPELSGAWGLALMKRWLEKTAC